jgi:hypothetical protein
MCMRAESLMSRELSVYLWERWLLVLNHHQGNHFCCHAAGSCSEWTRPSRRPWDKGSAPNERPMMENV